MGHDFLDLQFHGRRADFRLTMENVPLGYDADDFSIRHADHDRPDLLFLEHDDRMSDDGARIGGNHRAMFLFQQFGYKHRSSPCRSTEQPRV